MEASSLELALSDVEIIRAAYADETDEPPQSENASFPLHVTLRLSPTANIALELVDGYPISTNIQIASYRSKNTGENVGLECAVAAIRETATKCLETGSEGGLACCAAALDAWNDTASQTAAAAAAVDPVIDPSSITTQPSGVSNKRLFQWISGEPLTDRKSSFQAHACRVQSETDVRHALEQLMDGNSKLHRATHNMYAYRFTETLASSADNNTDPQDVVNNNKSILKHDNEDDGEDGAGRKLALLLQMRNADGVLVVVSRWYGGIHLGPKRFAHISNVARDVLVQLEESSSSSKT